MPRSVQMLLKLAIWVFVTILAAKLVFTRLHGHEDYQTHQNDGQIMSTNHDEHDEVNMPGLIGRNTTDAEVEELRAMFTNHKDIERRVENLPNGIRTVTETDNEELRDLLVSHVSNMLTRVAEGRDPQVPIQSLTLDPILANGDMINTEIKVTDKGVMVIQTSDDPKMVEHLQTHAAEVSDMAERGMQAVHENMARSH